ncbi:MAG: hypothetical protein QOK46_1918 [Microbacteriaceae bacterium]|nr:hypothetical protein [Microbacteriaceae bacterium]MDQ1554840.1 hypothetical protein [Microbacteriaceae bacterium]
MARPVARGGNPFAVPRRVELPESLSGTAFRTAGAGFSEKRLRAGDVDRPYHGVRSVCLDQLTVVGRCRAYEPRMPASQFFSHITAAQLYRIPLPPGLIDAAAVHVSVTGSDTRPRLPGVVGHRMSATVRPWMHRGFAVADPISTWCQLASVLGLDDLIAAGDFLVSGRVTDSGREPPLASIEQLRAGAVRFAGNRGARRAAEAVAAVRTGVDSRPETLLRLLLMRSGQPEPVINKPIFDNAGRRLGKPDLSYEWARTVLEYEGDGHRTDAARFRRDISRRERFEDAGWRVIRVTADDLFVDPDDFIRRTARTLARRAAALVSADLGPIRVAPASTRISSRPIPASGHKAP